MKFEQLLMQRSEEQHKRLALEEEVKKLQVELEGEETVRNVLECALNGSSMPFSHQRLSASLPAPAQVLVSELEMIEEEIFELERKVDELRLQLYQERAQVRDLDVRHQKLNNNLLREEAANRNHRSAMDDQRRSMSQNYEVVSRKERSMVNGDRRALFVSSSSDTRSLASSNREISELSRRLGGSKSRNRGKMETNSNGSGKVKPNELSEELLKCVIGIFLELNHTTSLGKEGSSSSAKLNTSRSCINSKGFIGKTPFGNCKSPTFLFSLNSSNFDPFAIFPDLDTNVRDVGPYKNFIQLTTSSLDITRFPECLTEIGKLRVLMSKLCDVDLTFLTYKQKLAFWINIYNACIMHAFLEHGLPSTQEKLLALMNKATLNVGGIVLNALAIEHFILRYPSESKNAPAYEKEMLLRHAYGLGYPEPNVTFALCRGTWSSPALRVYTAENIVNEMERAKVDYLEASIGVTSKKKIVVPKLLQWHMSDFADDMESLVEWIYSQLPRSGSLKRLIMECLNGETKSPVSKMVEVQPYESEFRYLLNT